MSLLRFDFFIINRYCLLLITDNGIEIKGKNTGDIKHVMKKNTEFVAVWILTFFF